MKICRRCRRRKPVSEFPCYWRKQRRRFTLDTMCRRCNIRRQYKNGVPQGQSYAEAKARHPEKVRARKVLNNALRSGVVTRRRCAVCGDRRTHAHHDDYSRPLDVRWLCPAHHGVLHRRNVGVLA